MKTNEARARELLMMSGMLQQIASRLHVLGLSELLGTDIDAVVLGNPQPQAASEAEPQKKRGRPAYPPYLQTPLTAEKLGQAMKELKASGRMVSEAMNGDHKVGAAVVLRYVRGEYEGGLKKNEAELLKALRKIHEAKS